MEFPIPPRMLSVRNKLNAIVLPFIFFLGATGLRLWNLGTQGLWYDETYTAFVSQQPPDMMMRWLIGDGVHPPLYYWIMAAWIRIFGNTAWAIRFPSAVAGGLSAVMVYLLVQKTVGKNEAILAAVLLSLSPFSVWYSQEARMYSIDCLASVTAVFFFWKFLQNRSLKNFLTMTLSHAILYGLHYFGIFLLLAETCFLILYRRKYGSRFVLFLLGQAAASLPLAWWAAILLQRTNGSFGIGWIPRPTWMDPILTVVNFFLANAGSWGIPAIIGAVILGVLFCASLGNPEAKEVVGFAFLWLILPLLMAWTLSQTVPVYIDRYMIFALPAAILLVAAGAKKLPGAMRFLLPGILILLMLTADWNINLPAEGFQKEEWREAVAYLREEYRPGDLILVRKYEEAIPLYYYRFLDRHWDFLERNQELNLSEIQKPLGRCFLIYFIPAQSAHTFGNELRTEFEESDPIVRVWILNNFQRVESHRAFHGLFIVVMQPKP